VDEHGLLHHCHAHGHAHGHPGMSTGKICVPSLRILKLKKEKKESERGQRIWVLNSRGSLLLRSLPKTTCVSISRVGEYFSSILRYTYRSSVRLLGSVRGAINRIKDMSSSRYCILASCSPMTKYMYEIKT
jgi:hypothetical protein